jgi:signal transduction histidine kinase
VKKPGIHARIIFSAFVVIFATTLTLDFVSVHITGKFMHKRFKDRISFLARYLALNSEVGVLIGDKSGLNSLALNLLGEEDVAQVEIMDNQRKVLVDLKRDVPGPLSEIESPILFKRYRDESMVIFSDQITPFGKQKIPGTEQIGTVRIHFSTHGIQQLMWTLTEQFLWFSSMLVILSGMLFYFISKSISVELKQLVTTTQQVARGDLSLRAKSGRLPEIRELSQAFNAMLDSLEMSREALDRVNREMVQQKTLAEVGKFSLMVAHEVKNPIGIIKSSMDILKRDLGVSSDNMLVSYIEDEIRRLNRLIEDFLLFSRPAKPKMQNLDLNEMLRDVISRFQVQNINADIEIEAQIPLTPCELGVDADLLTRAFLNILKNAAEANHDEGKLFVSAQNSNGKWTLSIMDQGDGILPENLSRIFEPFFTTRSKGTGLGLAFTSHAIKAHGGSITAQNNETTGALFRIEIPLRNSAPLGFDASPFPTE